jgi:hypothetical protein
MSIISRNHIEFMKQFIDDTNTLTAKLLKDQQSKYAVKVLVSSMNCFINSMWFLEIMLITLLLVK